MQRPSDCVTDLSQLIHSHHNTFRVQGVSQKREKERSSRVRGPGHLLQNSLKKKEHRKFEGVEGGLGEERVDPEET